MSAVSGAEVFAFEGFSLDPRQRRLFGPDGRSLPLSGRAFDTLLYLVEHPNQLIDKQALMKAVWPNVIVEDNNLNQNILIVRRVLGESPGEHRFIVTVPGRGFRFVPAVRRLDGASAAWATSKATEASLAPTGANAIGREPAARGEATSSTAPAPAPAPVRRRRLATLTLIAVLAVAALLTGVYALWRERSGATVTGARREAPSLSGTPENGARAGATAFTRPPHSIAVLPFVNLSGDKEQEYFSDGLTEELLNSLAHIDGLQVAARTSSFSFREHPDIVDVAHKLNVGTVLEGSVRRSGRTIRVTAQLVNAVTGFHHWSKTYDRDLGDVLKLQTEIATAVAEALKVTLLGDLAAKVELGGSHDSAAFDAYLRGLRLARVPYRCRDPIDAFSKAIERDPNYALAYAMRALVRWDCTVYSPDYLQQPSSANAVRVDAERAIELAPDLPEAYVAMGNLEQGVLNLSAADHACTRALALAPRNDQVLYYCSGLAVWFGRGGAGITLARRAVAIDPLNARSYRALGDALRFTRRYNEATAAYQHSIALDPEHSDYVYSLLGVSYYLAGNLSEAQASCEARPDSGFLRELNSHEAHRDVFLWCGALIYQKLGRQEAASAAMRRFVELSGDAPAYQYAEIHAQWGDHAKALEWLDTAMRLRDPGLEYLKTDPLMDPLRKEPRFRAIERELKFPD